MSTPWLVTLRDTGSGLREQQHDRFLPPQSAYDSIQSLARQFTQLPLNPGIPDAEIIQFASVSATFAPLLKRWVLAVQGFGPDYGRAGTQQFVFLPAAAELGSAWAGVCKCLDETLVLGPSDVEMLTSKSEILGWPGFDNVQRVLLQALRELEDPPRQSRLVALNCDSALSGSMISSLLAILPETLRRRFDWSTLFLGRSLTSGVVTLSGAPTVACDQLQSSLTQVWSEQRSSADGELPVEWHEIVEWLVGEAERGQYPGANLDVDSVSQWMNKLDGMRPLSVESALSMLQGTTGQLPPQQLRRWLREKTTERLLALKPGLLSQLLNRPERELVQGAVLAAGQDPGVQSQLDSFLAESFKARSPLPMILVNELSEEFRIRVASDALENASASVRRESQNWLESLKLPSSALEEFSAPTPASLAPYIERSPQAAVKRALDDENPVQILRDAMDLLGRAHENPRLDERLSAKLIVNLLLHAKQVPAGMEKLLPPDGRKRRGIRSGEAPDWLGSFLRNVDQELAPHPAQLHQRARSEVATILRPFYSKNFDELQSSESAVLQFLVGEEVALSWRYSDLHISSIGRNADPGTFLGLGVRVWIVSAAILTTLVIGIIIMMWLL